MNVSKNKSPYYADVGHIHALLGAARHIKGTPFAENSASFGPQGGSDCWSAVNHVLAQSGSLARIQLPPYSLSWTASAFDEHILNQFNANIQNSLRVSWELVPFDGVNDLLSVFKIGDVARIRQKGPPHCAVKLAGRDFLHADSERGVIIEQLNSRRQLERIDRIYRAYFTS